MALGFLDKPAEPGERAVWVWPQCDGSPLGLIPSTNGCTPPSSTAEESPSQSSNMAMSPSSLFPDIFSADTESGLYEDNDWVAWALEESDSPGDENRQCSGSYNPTATALPVKDQSLSRRTPEPRVFKTLTDTPSALCGYFFEHVIGLYCAWDGRENYMRTTSSQFWQSCAPLYHTMQSMAAVCLADDFPHLLPLATEERTKALDALRMQYSDCYGFTARLMALMLLAQTSSWHCPDDLAVEQFRTVQRMLGDWQQETQDSTDFEFFARCMGYWKMLLSFITDSDNLAHNDTIIMTAGDRGTDLACRPHEFSGVSSTMVETLSQVGNLIFRARKRSSSPAIMSEKAARDFLDSLSQARSLEKKLLGYRQKDPALVLETDDPVTSASHFCHIDEAYRCTGLLQLYRVFPDLLRGRYRPWSGHDELLSPQEPVGQPTEDEMRKWLSDLALYILSHLRAIPFESRTRCAQPWLLVAAATELRHRTTLGDGQLDRHDIEIVRARRFISTRLQAYTHVLPLRKVKKVVDLVNLIWSELDAGKDDTYWVDVTYEQQFTTIMG